MRINPRLRAGLPVLSSQGSVIGEIAAVAEGRFQITDGGREIWLRDDAVRQTTDAGTLLVCDELHLYQHTATPPAPTIAGR